MHRVEKIATFSWAQMNPAIVGAEVVADGSCEMEGRSEGSTEFVGFSDGSSD